jgi:translation initiation factor IF-3
LCYIVVTRNAGPVGPGVFGSVQKGGEEINDRLRINTRIRAPEVLLIGADGRRIGVKPIQEALSIAAQEGMDLVEVDPQASPPVCRLLDYGKFRYEQTKKERAARKRQRMVEIKEVRLRPKISDHDLQIKVSQARRFLDEGNRVKVTLRFRGREWTHGDIARELLQQVATDLDDVAVVEQKPTSGGRDLVMLLAPRKD